MKKLMIAAAIVCAAAISQAATFQWSTTSSQYAPGIDLANLAVGHYDNSSSVYLKGMSAVTWTFAMSLDNGTDTDSLDGSIAYSLNKIQVKNLSSDVVFKPASASDPDNVVDYTIVITGTYMDSNGNEWTITSDPIVSTETIGSMSSGNITSPNATGWTVSTSAVPEPTSAMLLLLGMAGLALRRRRA